MTPEALYILFLVIVAILLAFALFAHCNAVEREKQRMHRARLMRTIEIAKQQHAPRKLLFKELVEARRREIANG